MLISAGEICVFCLTHRSRKSFIDRQYDLFLDCQISNRLLISCSYGMRCEYPNDTVEEQPKQVAKKDLNLCLSCGLHPKNPKFAANNCSHIFTKQKPHQNIKW